MIAIRYPDFRGSLLKRGGNVPTGEVVSASKVQLGGCLSVQDNEVARPFARSRQICPR